MTSSLAIASLWAGVGLLVLGFVVVARCWAAIEPHQALIVTSPGQTRVRFVGGLVMPLVQRAERIDLRVVPLVIDRRGDFALGCRDGQKLDIRLLFAVRVTSTEEALVRVAQAIGCERAADPETIRNLFEARFSEAIKQVAGQITADDLLANRDRFRDELYRTIGNDLAGYQLDYIAIDELRPS